MSLLERISGGLLQMLAELAGKAGFVLAMMGAVALFIDFWIGLPAFLGGCLLLAFSFYTWQGRRHRT